MKRSASRTIKETVQPELFECKDEVIVLRSLFAATPTIAFFQDLDGRFRFLTFEAARSFGLPMGELEDRTWQELGHRSDLMNSIDDIRREALIAGKPLEGELFSPPDRRYYEYRVAPIAGIDGKLVGTLTAAEDITEQKEMKGLREREERLRATVDGARDPVFIKDRDGRYLAANSATLQTLGRSLNDMLGRNDREIYSDPEVVRSLMANDRRVMRSGVDEVLEERIQTPGGYRIFLTSRTPYRDPDGRIIGIVGIARDITDRKKMEEDLRAGERWFSSLIENAPVAIAISQRGMTTFGNLRFLEMFGHESIDELKGRPFIDQIAPEDRGRALEFALSVERGRPQEVEMELVGLRKDGSTFPFQAAITSLDLGDGAVVLGFFTDVTERKKVEEEMIQSRKKFESIFSASNEGIALHDIVYDQEGRIVDYRILDVNPSYERITGIPKDKAVGALASELYGTVEPPYLDTFTQVGVTGKPAVLETYFSPMDKHFLISVSSPAKGRFATMFIDITERKRLEKELEEAKSRAEIYVDLLIHDINNYNTAALGYLQLAEMRLSLDDKDRKLIVRPIQVLNNSSELIANVRDLKLVEAGRERARPYDICRLLKEVKEAYEDPPGREVTINLQESNNCWVMTSGLIRDAFSNIVSNAINHSSGPITVDISIERRYQGRSGQVRVSIEDNGPGIPDERKEAIFDRALMGLTKPVSRGLGLYLVKRLVEEYNGEVWVEDRVPGDDTKGARFVIMLPAASLG